MREGRTGRPPKLTSTLRYTLHTLTDLNAFFYNDRRPSSFD